MCPASKGIERICYMLKKYFSAALVTLALTVAMQPAMMAASPTAVRYYNRGIDAYAQGDTAKALEFFSRAVERDAQYADAHYNLGSLHYQMGNYNQARDSFMKTLELNPADAHAKYNLALTLEKMNQPDDAVKYFMQVPASHEKHQKAKEKIEQLKPYLKDKSVVALMPTGRSVGPTQAGPLKVSVDTFARGFFGPTGMTIGPGGFMYVANYSKNAIYKVGADGEKVMFAQGEALQGPIGLTYDTQTGEMYVANYLKNNVVRVTGNGEVSVLASGLKKPYNLFLDTTNHVLYVSEQETNTISRIQLH